MVNNIERNTALKVCIFVKAFKCSILNGGETFGNTPWKSHQPCTEDGAVITYVDTRHEHIVNEIWLWVYIYMIYEGSSGAGQIYEGSSGVGQSLVWAY